MNEERICHSCAHIAIKQDNVDDRILSGHCNVKDKDMNYFEVMSSWCNQWVDADGGGAEHESNS